MSDKIENSQQNPPENKPMSAPDQASNIPQPTRELHFVESESSFSTNSEQSAEHFEE